jgi:hypothetical protein
MLFLYNLLDATLSIQGEKLPPFTAFYLESRVLKGPEMAILASCVFAELLNT